MTHVLEWQRPVPKTETNYLPDHRFCNLLSKRDWNTLPRAVQRRFSKKIKGNKAVVYIGKTEDARMSWLGRAVANVACVIGAPLPLRAEVDMPSVVSVTEDRVQGGQIWTRLYATRNGFPQIVHSAKRFRGKTGLEEYIGYGISVALTVSAESGCLKFRSAGFVFDLFSKRFSLPRFLTPFDLTIRHQNIDDDHFYFLLELKNSIVGELIYQKVQYREEDIR